MMSKTWLTILSALLLVNLSIGMLLTRRAILGDAIDGPPSASDWNVKFVIAGKTSDENLPHALTISLPPDFRHQHVLDGKSNHGNLRIGPLGRALIWKAAAKDTKTFRLTYEFRCLLETRQPTRDMRDLTHRLDRKPSAETLRQSLAIQSKHPKIQEQSENLPKDIQSLYEFVDALDYEPVLEEQSALDCLIAKSGDSLGKSRLLIALCRHREIPARLVTGVMLLNGRASQAHYSVEVWLQNEKKWLALDPTHHLFGRSSYPPNYLILHYGDDSWIRSENARLVHSIHAQRLNSSSDSMAIESSSGLRRFLLRTSLHSLPPQEQHLVRFLLLLPLAALIVCLFRVVIGLPTFGTFGPALLGITFLDWSTLIWGIAAFILIILVGWGLRRFLDQFRLLMVPRTSALLTMIVIFLILLIVVTSNLSIPLTNYLSLFPLVILTHMVERFWTVESEDGTRNAFKSLTGTLIVIVTISLSLAPRAVTSVLFRYPELLGVALACTLLLGRYTGYRLAELRRFRDLTLLDEAES